MIRERFARLDIVASDSNARDFVSRWDVLRLASDIDIGVIEALGRTRESDDAPIETSLEEAMELIRSFREENEMLRKFEAKVRAGQTQAAIADLDHARMG